MRNISLLQVQFMDLGEPRPADGKFIHGFCRVVLEGKIIIFRLVRSARSACTFAWIFLRLESFNGSKTGNGKLIGGPIRVRDLAKANPYGVN